MNEPSDEQLMSHVREGRLDALEAIYHRYQRPLIAFFLRSGGDRAMAEDLLQEVFLRVLKYRSSYDPARRLRSWIFGIAHNAAIDAAQARRGDTGHAAGTAGSAVAGRRSPAEFPDPLARLEADREARSVRRALDHLSESDRHVLLLAKVEELAYADIARILECSEGAVKVRVHRALGRLSGHLAEGAEGEAG